MISFLVRQINNDDDDDDDDDEDDNDDDDEDDDDDDEGWVGRGVGWWVLIYLTYRVCQNQCDCL